MNLLPSFMKRFYTLQILFTIVLVFGATLGRGQSTEIIMPRDTTITACDVVLLDPGGNGNYPNNIEGYIVRLVPTTPGSYISLSFETFEIEPSNDELYIYDGNFASEEEADELSLVGAFSGLSEQTPGDIIATNATGALTLIFYSDNILNGQGFRIRVGCNFSLAMTDGNLGTLCNTGILNPGGWQDGYAPNTDVTSTVYADNNRQLFLTFPRLDLGEGDSLFVFNGETADDALKIAAYGIGDNTSPVGVLGSNSASALTLRFVSDAQGEGSGFQAFLSCIAGQTLDMRQGLIVRTCGVVFRDPGGNRNYPNLEDEVVVSTFYPQNRGDKLSVNFTTLQIEPPEDFGDGDVEFYDYLEVRDGATEDAPLLARLAGTQTGRPIEATNPEGALTFVFSSDFDINGAGWEAVINCIAPLVMADNQTVSTCDAAFVDPGGADNYPANQDITYTLQSPSTRDQIQVTFNSFDLAEGDTLYVYNGRTTESTLLLSKFHQGDIPPTLFSSNLNRALTFRLVSDAGSTGAGWEASVSCVNSRAFLMQNGRFSVCDASFEDAGGNQNYMPGVTQKMTLFPTTEGDKISIIFNTFHVGDPDFFDEDVLKIYNDTTDNPDALIGEYRGKIDNVFEVVATNPTGALTLVFESDESEQFPGWRARINCESPARMVNGTFNVCDAFFTDPGGSNANYGNNANVITTLLPSDAAQQKVLVSFNSFDLAQGDMLEVYRGTAIDAANLIGTFTGQTLPTALIGDRQSGALTFRFSSNSQGRAPGWDARVTCISKESVIMTNQTFEGCTFQFQDDGGNGVYSNNQTLITTFRPSEAGKQMRVLFNRFSLEEEFDYLRVYNGSEISQENLLAELTGETLPAPITANNAEGILTFEFTSDINTNAFGWDATLTCVAPQPMQTVVQTGCEFFFLDPGGSSDYAPNQSVVQTFTAEQGQLIANFQQIALATGDQLQIFDGVSTNAPLLTTLTAEQNRYFGISTEGSLTFRFISDGFAESAGWEAKLSCWEEFRTCGGTFTDPGGAENYPLDAYLTVTYYPEQEGEQVRVVFKELDLGEDAYLYVYNGEFEDFDKEIIELSSETTTLPVEITSTDETGALTFVFDSEFAATGKGWDADVLCFQPLRMRNFTFNTCSSILQDSGGDINPYQNNENFTATIYPQSQGGGPQANAASAITFQSFDVAIGDTLYIYDGETPSPSALIGAFTGTQKPPFIYATNPTGALTYRFVSDGSNVGTGWQANIDCFTGFFDMQTTVVNTCGLTFRDGGGNASYANNRQDTLTFYPQELGAKLFVNFIEFSVEEDFDYLYLYDGTSAAPESLVGTFSGSTLPDSYTATNAEGALTFVFTSDDIITEEGWTASINCISPLVMQPGTAQTCRSVFYDPGSFNNPYPTNQTITQTIAPSTSGTNLAVTFSEFDLAMGDTLFVYNGTTVSEETLLGAYSGTQATSFLFGDNGALTFQLVARSVQPGEGWTGQIICFNGTLPMQTLAITGCGLNFQDPGGPNNYPNSSEELTVLYPAILGDKVSIDFKSFSLEEGFDSLYVYDGEDQTATLLGAYSGNQSPGKITATNSVGALALYFVSDSDINEEGWTADVTCIRSDAMQNNLVVNACQRIFLDPGGLENYPDNYQGITTFRASEPNRQLKLTFNQFEIDQSDALYIFDGETAEEENLIGVYSGNTSPLTLTSENAAFTFLFVSDGSSNSQGWDALIECISAGRFQNVTPAELDNLRFGDAAWGDYDADGDMDIVAVGWNVTTQQEETKIFRNEGGLSFSIIEAFLIDGVTQSQVVWEDYNQDGYPDITLLGINAAGVPITKVYRNEIQRGDGTFIDIGANLTGLYNGSIAWGDYDQDGDPDLLVAGTDAENSRSMILYRNQKGILEEQSLNLNDFQEQNIHWGDYDADGDLDILTSVWIYKNQTVEDEEPLFKKTQVRAVFDGDIGYSDWADFDADGDLDVFLSFYQDNDATVSNRIYENTGNDDFSTILLTLNQGADESQGGFPSLVDFNGDGNVDVTYSTYGIPTFWKIRAGTAEQFLQQGTVDFQLSHFKWADFDGDNDPDLLVQPLDSDFGELPGIRIFENQTLPTPNRAPNTPSNLAFELFNNEVVLRWDAGSDAETATEALAYNIYVYNAADSLNTNFNVSPESVLEGSRTVANRGNVGQTTSYTLRGLEEGQYFFAVQTLDAGQAASEFSPELPFSVTNYRPDTTRFFPSEPGLFQKVAWGDYDSDGDLDVLMSGIEEAVDDFFAQPTPIVRIFSNENGQTLRDITPADFLQIQGGVAQWVDYNNDGKLDILLAGEGAGNVVRTQLYKQTDDGTWAPVNANLLGMTNGTAAWGDYDQDGDPDLFISGQDESFSFFAQLYRNDGNDLFTPIATEITPLADGDATWEDYNGDGKPDLLVIGAAEVGLQLALRTILYQNQGNGIFQEVATPLPNVFNGAVDWADFNGDSHPDILINGALNKDASSRTSKVYANISGDVFQEITTADLREVSGQSIWGDYDNDGDSDILLYDPNTQATHLYRNQEGDFVANTLGVSRLQSGNISWTDFNGDNRLDIFLTGVDANASARDALNPNTVSLFNSTLVSADSPPDAPELVASNTLATFARIQWNAINRPSVSYNIQLKRNDTTVVAPLAATATGKRKILARGNAGFRTFYEIDSLADGAYTWAVQAISPSYVGGEFSETGTFIICDAFNRLAPVEFSINVNPDEIGPGGSVTFTADNPNNDIVRWQWNFGDNTTGEGQTIQHTYENPGPYPVVLTITNAIGCVKVGMPVELRVSDRIPIRIANVVTPNGDGQNDVLQIDNIQSYPENEFTVLNMWGQEVFSTLNYQNDWQGADKDGNPLPPGNYIVILKLNTVSTDPFKEIITIVR